MFSHIKKWSCPFSLKLGLGSLELQMSELHQAFVIYGPPPGELFSEDVSDWTLKPACCPTISSVYNCLGWALFAHLVAQERCFFRRIGRHKLVYALPVPADAGRLQASLRYMASGVNFYTLTCMFVSYLGVKEQRSTYNDLFLCRPWQVYS